MPLWPKTEKTFQAIFRKNHILQSAELISILMPAQLSSNLSAYSHTTTGFMLIRFHKLISQCYGRSRAAGSAEFWLEHRIGYFLQQQ